MTEVSLSCFKAFRCIAGACPDTCCAGWEVDLDDDILCRYQKIPGALGDEIRSAICQEDGYTFFRTKNGQCPFLNKEKLCRLILALGEDVLSVTCREHPRFWEEYGDRRETCLSISCPEAARLLLEEPLTLCTAETDEAAPEDPELDSEFFHQLLIFRQALFALAQSRRSLTDQFSLALDAAENGITLPPEGEITPDFWDAMPAPPLSLSLSGYFAAMESMEFTRPQLKELLPRVIASGAALPLSDPEVQESGSRILFYFLYRYVLRGVWSGLVEETVRFSVYSTAAILALSAHMEAPTLHQRILDAAVLYSREVEHSPENMELLYEHLCSGKCEYS